MKIGNNERKIDNESVPAADEFLSPVPAGALGNGCFLLRRLRFFFELTLGEPLPSSSRSLTSGGGPSRFNNGSLSDAGVTWDVRIRSGDDDAFGVVADVDPFRNSALTGVCGGSSLGLPEGNATLSPVIEAVAGF